MGNAPEIRDVMRLEDATLSVDLALPTVGGTVYSVGYDLGALTGKGARLADMEFIVSHPALAVGLMVNADTLKIDILTDTALPIDGSSTVYAASIISSLGAGGVGCAAAEGRIKIPQDGSRYIGVLATHVGTGAPQTADMTTKIVF